MAEPQFSFFCLCPPYRNLTCPYGPKKPSTWIQVLISTETFVHGWYIAKTDILEFLFSCSYRILTYLQKANINSRRPTSHFLFPDPFNYGKVIIFYRKKKYHYEIIQGNHVMETKHKNIQWENDETRIGEQEMTSRTF